MGIRLASYNQDVEKYATATGIQPTITAYCTECLMALLVVTLAGSYCQQMLGDLLPWARGGRAFVHKEGYHPHWKGMTPRARLYLKQLVYWKI